MIEFTFWDILRNLLLATRWTIVLSLIAFVGGATVGLLLTFMRLSSNRWLQRLTSLYVDLFPRHAAADAAVFDLLWRCCHGASDLCLVGGFHRTDTIHQCFSM